MTMTEGPPVEVVTDEPDRTASVFSALGRVMKDVTVVRKEREQSSTGGRFMFRGIDDVMNAVGPAFRKHGVICLPNVLDVSVEHATTSRGSAMTVTRVQVEYTFYGPQGDHVTCRTPGEAFDTGDKSTAKAMSVAYRTALLQALTLPTDEPDPDETVEQLAPRHQEDRRQLPPSGPAHRSRGRQGRQAEDPWTVFPLRPEGLDVLGRLVLASSVEDATALYRVVFGQGTGGQQHVFRDDLAKVLAGSVDDADKVARWLNMAGPLELLEVAKRVGKHLADEGIGLARRLEDERMAPAAGPIGTDTGQPGEGGEQS